MLMEGRRAEALALLTDDVEDESQTPDRWYLRGVILLDLARYREAIRCFGKAIDAGADGADCHLRLALALQSLGLLPLARSAIDAALAREPDSYHVQFSAGVIARACGDFSVSRIHFEHALRLVPDDPLALGGLAAATIDDGDLEGGLAMARQSLARHPEEMGLWEAVIIASNRLGRARDSLDALERAVAIVSRIRAAEGEGPVTKMFLNQAIQLMELGQHGDAARVLADELRRGPSGETQFHLALRLLYLGRYREGWALYTARWNIDPNRGHRVCTDIPRWDGQPLDGRTILLGEEQGIGDVIQFARYAPALKARGARVLIGVRSELRELASGFRGVDHVVAAGDALPACDFFLNLAALPHALGIEVDDAPVEVPYLDVDPERRRRWRAALENKGAMRVGLVWAGNPTHVRDHERSMSVAQLEPVLRVPGVSFYSLQKGPPVEQLRQSSLAGLVTDLDPSIADFADTLAILSELDLVITVDTSVAHAAGAIGKPVWMLVSEPAEHRWLESREDSIWYPTMRLFRQSVRRDWSGVVDRVAGALATARDRRDRGGGILAPKRGTTDPERETIDLDGVPQSAEAHDGVFQLPAVETPEGRSLRYYGEYLPTFCTLSRQLVRPGATVVEVGAGIGAHSLGLARWVGSDGDLVAIEPDVTHSAFLAENVQGNRLDNVTLLLRGIGVMGDFPSVDSLCFADLDGLVLHGEYASTKTLAGCEASIWRARPWVLAETSDVPRLVTMAEALHDMGYRLWRFDLPLFAEGNFARRSDDIFGGMVRAGLLAMPEERDIAIGMSGLVPFDPSSG